MDNPRKRRRSEAPPTNGHSSKHTKPDTTYNAFTDEQHAIIETTASFFQIHPSDLSAAIGSLRKSSRIASTSSHKIPILFDDLQQQEKFHLTFPEKEIGVPSAAMGNEWDDSNGHSNSVTDGTFGFNTAPGPWSQCFANLLPSRNTLLPSTDSGIPQFDATSHLDQHNLVGGPHPDINEYYTSHSGQPSSPTSRSSSYINRSQHQSFDADEDSLCNGLFACDVPFGQFSTPWQPTSSQSTQPPASHPAMVYPQQDEFMHNGYRVPLLLPGQDMEASDIMSEKKQSRYPENQSTPWNSRASEYPLIDVSVEEEENKVRRGPFRDPLERAQTAQTRRDNACLRCKMQRTRCIPDPFDPRGVCLTCKKVSNQKITKLPCLRYKITDTRLFRVGYVPGHVWSNRWQSLEMNDVSTWSDSEIRTIQITQDYSPNPLSLKVRRFTPVEGDMLSRSWVHGSIKKSVMLPPYAIENLKEAEKAYREYIDKEGTQFFLSTLDRDNKLIWETYSMAITASNNSMTEQERILLKLVLRLWVAVRIITRSERICGNDTLGMPQDMMDQSSPMHGKIPITPIMGAQIDVILIQGILIPLRGMILEQLQKLILAHRPQNWLCIYLCVFILLHNTSLITKQDISYARKHGLKTRFAMVDIIKELHTGANILLAYFHYCCKGFRPFSEDWDATETLSMAELDPYQIKFVQRTAAYVKVQDSKFQKMREQCLCDDEHYFIAQLYEEDWLPRSTD